MPQLAFQPPYHSQTGMSTVQLDRLFRGARGPLDDEHSRTFSEADKRKAANEGAALPDGSYPIYNQKDAENAYGLRNNGKASADTVVAHVRKRVKALGLKMPGEGSS